MCPTPFWGDVGIKKWSRFFCCGTRCAIFWHVKTGTFAKSARYQVPKKGTSGAETKKLRPLFNTNIPQNGLEHVCFIRLALWGGFLTNFKNLAFWHRFTL